jgi:SHS2 domain-containing protein
MPGRPYEILSHTADVGIVTRGSGLGEVIENAAFAMFDLMYELPAAAAVDAVEFESSADGAAELLLEVLAELLYRADAGDLAFSAFAVRVDAGTARVRALAQPTAGVELHGPPIKAVTYHRLRCERVDGAWEAQVIFDV